MQVAEAIDVNGQQGETARRRLSCGDSLLDPIAQLSAVGKPGQRIEIRQSAYLLLRLLVLSAGAQTGDSEREIVRQLPQQRDLFGVECVGGRGEDREHAEHTGIGPQRQRDRGCVAARQCLRTPGSSFSDRSAKSTLTCVDPGANRGTGRAPAELVVFPAHPGDVEVARAVAILRHRTHRPGFVMLRESNPRHAVAARFDQQRQISLSKASCVSA